ncbi:hypothetical protein GO755_39045 [Spirosoma sp. HMF4905]|uniref:Uncharacterized protein n=1 Tax=Spirosoma arboris TaxID=2682092 RepID=A0A7K1SR52_9BACT|nr:hypothetical protein [Spirosoma arboris]MVM36076.1 hypothetical protein [Spirosoma arboris]
MKYKVEIWVSFNYGAWTLSFSKIVELDFAPFYGLIFIESSESNDLLIEVSEGIGRNCQIQYDLNEKAFLVDVRNWWKHAVSDETIDSTIAEFIEFGYVRQDTTDVVALKELMAR